MSGLVEWAAGRPQELYRLYQEGGWVMPFLVLEALLLWFALGYRMVALRRGSRKPVRALVGLYGRPGAEVEPGSGGVIVRAVVRGLELARSSGDDLRKHLDAAFAEHEQDVAKFGVMVEAIVIIAPLTGLLGTVSGMIETFDSLAEMALFTQSGGIAGGISEALFTTQMGLAVAIPGHLVGQTLDRRQKVMETELAQVKEMLCTGVGEATA